MGRCERLGRICEVKTDTAVRRPRRIRDESETVDDERDDAEPQRPINRGKALLGEIIDDPETPLTRPLPPPDPPTTDLSINEAAYLLDIYRRKHTPTFPFVPIPQHYEVEELRNQTPMVCRAVMLAANPLPPSRVDLMKNEVLGELGSKLLVGDDRSLDNLQALLICIAW